MIKHPLVKFIQFLMEVVFYAPEGSEVEMKWHHKYDGDTKWHPMYKDDSVGRYGYFPYDADYRVKLNKKR